MHYSFLSFGRIQFRCLVPDMAMAIESVLGTRHDGNRLTEQGLDDYRLEDIHG